MGESVAEHFDAHDACTWSGGAVCGCEVTEGDVEQGVAHEATEFLQE